MAAITSYTTLRQAIIDTAEDDGLEFAAYLDTAIDLAEEYLWRDLELPELETKVPGTLTAASNVLAKPANYRFANYIKIIVNGQNIFLKKRRDDFLQDYWPDPTVIDIPKYYSDSSASSFLLAPTPQQPYAYEIKYTPRPIKLSAANATNYYTDKCQDILFYACMAEMVRFMKAWTQIQAWESAYSAARDNWNMNAMKFRRDDGTTPQNRGSGPNDLKHTVPTQS